MLNSSKSKVIFISLLVFIFYGIVDFSIPQFISFPSFITLERKEAIKDVNRVYRSVKREIHYLDSLYYDWAAWTDTYVFVHNKKQDFVSINLSMDTFITNKLNLFHIVNLNGTVLWEGVYSDPQKNHQIELVQFPQDRLTLPNPLLTFKAKEKQRPELTIPGIIQTAHGSVLIASRPVFRSNHIGDLNTVLIMGRFLTSEIIETLKKQSQINFNVHSFTEKSISTDAEKLLPQYPSDPTVQIKNINNDNLQVQTIFSYISGKPALFIQTKFSKKNIC